MPPSGQPPPSSSGNLKYVAIGLFFLAGAVGLWLVTQKAPPPPISAPAPASVERVNSMAQPEIDLVEPVVPDAAVAEPVEPTKARHSGTGNKGNDWDCTGDLQEAAAGKVLNENRPQIRACYERRLKVNNVLQGDIQLRVKVGSSGKVLATAISGSLSDEAVFACVRTLAQGWTFPVPTGGNCAVVQVPFHFSPKP